MDLGVGQVALEGAGSVRAEDFVVGPPTAGSGTWLSRKYCCNWG
jgi:hypothetical protein